MNSANGARTNARTEDAQAASRSDRTGTEETRRGKRVLLGFLGNKHDKDRTRYVLSKAPGDEGEERSWETEMITEALCRFFAPDETVLFLTKKAREVWEEDIATRLASWNPCIVDIPDGQSEEEMYDIMAAVVEALPEEGTALLDITHGFRSLPALMLFAVFYAMAVKKTDVESILYGAFRFGGTEEEKATTPVLRMDLLLYLTRLAQGFRTFLDAGILPSAAVDLAKRKWKSPLVGKATDSIAGMGSALRTGLIPLLHRRMGDLDRALPEMKNLPRLERLLFETVACSYRNALFPLTAATEPAGERTPCATERTPVRAFSGAMASEGAPGAPEQKLDREEFERELALATWYLDHNLLPQAASMLRETGVNLLLFRLGLTQDWFCKATRGIAERTVKDWNEVYGDPVARWIAQIQHPRNWMSHMGFSEEATDIAKKNPEEKIRNTLNKLVQEMRENLEAWLALAPHPLSASSRKGDEDE